MAPSFRRNRGAVFVRLVVSDEGSLTEQQRLAVTIFTQQDREQGSTWTNRCRKRVSQHSRHPIHVIARSGQEHRTQEGNSSSVQSAAGLGCIVLKDHMAIPNYAERMYPVCAHLPTVSVVIPAYNALSTLGRALRSVEAQTYPQIVETIVVDDGSDENTGVFLHEHFPMVRYLRQDHTGVPGSARNRGAAAASGKLLAFLDADDEWVPEKISLQAGFFIKHPETQMVLTGYQVVTQDGRREMPSITYPPDGSLLSVVECLAPCPETGAYAPALPSSWVVDRRTYNELGGQDTSWPNMADWQFVNRMVLAGHPVAFLDRPLFLYYQALHSFKRAIFQGDTYPDQVERVVSFVRALKPEEGRRNVLDVRTYEAILCSRARGFGHDLTVYGNPRGALEMYRMAWGCRVPLSQRFRLLLPIALLALPAAVIKGRCTPWRRVVACLGHLRRALRAAVPGRSVPLRRSEQ